MLDRALQIHTVEELYMKNIIVNKAMSIFLCREQMDDIESKRPESPIGTRYSKFRFPVCKHASLCRAIIKGHNP